jgi:hypothetical protein
VLIGRRQTGLSEYGTAARDRHFPMNSGFAGIDNPLFYADGTTMLFGDAKKSVSAVTEELKAL